MKRVSAGRGVKGLLFLIIVGLLAAVVWYINWVSWDMTRIYQTTRQAAGSTLPAPKPHQPSTAKDGMADWRTYTWGAGRLQFRYPADWFVREESATNRVYISNVAAPVTKEDRPSYYEQVWLSVDPAEAGADNEASVRAGEPQGRAVAAGPRSIGQIATGDSIITTYNYYTSGGQTLQAFWRGPDGQRYYATNATEVGQSNQADMVAVLKNILSTIHFTR